MWDGNPFSNSCRSQFLPIKKHLKQLFFRSHLARLHQNTGQRLQNGAFIRTLEIRDYPLFFQIIHDLHYSLSHSSLFWELLKNQQISQRFLDFSEISFWVWLHPFVTSIFSSTEGIHQSWIWIEKNWEGKEPTKRINWINKKIKKNKKNRQLNLWSKT